MNRFKSVMVIVCMFVILAALPLISACNKASTSEAKTLKIGAMASLTGPAAPGQIEMMDGYKLAAEWINEKGGINVNGQPYMIEIIGEDDMSNPSSAASAALKMIQDGAKFIAGPLVPQCNLAMTEVCEGDKIIRMKPNGIGGTAEVNPQNHYQFASNMNVYNVPHIYDYMQKNYPEVKKVAIVTVDDPGGQPGTDACIQEAQSRGLEITFNERYPFGTSDFYPILTKALATNPDGLDLVCGMMWQAEVMKSARELGFEGPIWGVAPIGDLHVVANMVGKDFAHDIFFPEMDVKSPKMTDIIKDIGERVQKETKADFLTAQVDAWAGLWVIAQGIEAAQSLDTDAVVTAMENMKSVDTPLGKAVMGGMDLFGVNHVVIRPMPLSRIENGEVDFIEFLKP